MIGECANIIDGEISSSEALFVQGINLDFSVSASATTELVVDGQISASNGITGMQILKAPVKYKGINPVLCAQGRVGEL